MWRTAAAKKIHTGVVHEGLCPVGHMMEQEESVRKKEEQRKYVMKWTQVHFPSLCAICRKEAEEPGVKFNLGRREVGER